MPDKKAVFHRDFFEESRARVSDESFREITHKTSIPEEDREKKSVLALTKNKLIRGVVFT